jgi:transcriptional regulator GlxA family with amidase domain
LASRRLCEQALVESSAATVGRTLSTPDEVLVVVAQRLLRESIASPPSLDELAFRVGSNRRKLSEAFRAFCGQAVFEWLREERFRRAQEMLSNTSMPVSAISDALGYSTPTNFSKAFRERFGVTPSDMRAGEVSPPPKKVRGSAALAQQLKR